MPYTTTYGFPYEDLDDQPGWSLTGGLYGTEQILAIDVDRELERVESTSAAAVDQVAADLLTLENTFLTTGAQTIATIDTGAGGNTTNFDLPSGFRDVLITWQGASDGSGEIDSLAMRFNSDAGSNYQSVLNRNTAAGAFTSDVGTFTVMRGGQVGTFRSSGFILIPQYGLSGSSKTFYGACGSIGQSLGSNIFATTATGRWTSTVPITNVRIWPSGQFWEGDPHLTLIGIP